MARMQSSAACAGGARAHLLAWITCLAWLALASAAGAATRDGLHFSHRDWELACDTTGTCRAAGYSALDSPEEYRASVLVTRLPGAWQAPTGQVRFADWIGPGPDGPLRLRIDGRDLGVVHTPTLANPTLGTLAPAQLQALLDAVRDDPDVAFIDDAGQRWPLSTAGAMAVLLKMDEYQGRLLTADALVRRGKLKPSAVRAAPPRASVRVVPFAASRPDDARLAGAAVRQALVATLGSDHGCEGLEEIPAPLEVQRLSADSVLVSTTCWRGAYNKGVGYWIVDDQPPHRAQLVTTDASGHGDGRIHAEHRGRGLGDCLSIAEWAWTGTTFVQTLEATTGKCRAIGVGGAWHLPTIVVDVVDD